MGKKLLVTEKPSVAMEFAKALKIMSNRKKWIHRIRRMDNNMVCRTSSNNELSRKI